MIGLGVLMLGAAALIVGTAKAVEIMRRADVTLWDEPVDLVDTYPPEVEADVQQAVTVGNSWSALDELQARRAMREARP